jgi:hypothetical protein
VLFFVFLHSRGSTSQPRQQSEQAAIHVKFSRKPDKIKKGTKMLRPKKLIFSLDHLFAKLPRFGSKAIKIARHLH